MKSPRRPLPYGYRRAPNNSIRVRCTPAKNRQGVSGVRLQWSAVNGLHQSYWVATAAEAHQIAVHLHRGLSLDDALREVHL